MTAAGALILGRLTPREADVVRCTVMGFTNRQIAAQLQLREQVVKNYMRAIFDKSGADNRVDLILKMLYHGVVECPCERCRAAVAAA